MLLLNSKKWESAIVGEIALAVHVPYTTKRAIHNNRPFHGLVWNEAGSSRDYLFSDGTVLHTGERELFYLPKGSSYKTSNGFSQNGSTCYAINFSAELSDQPFSVSFRNSEQIEKLFKTAANVWKRQDAFCDMTIRKILYEIILLTAKEQQKKYTPSSATLVIAPAPELIKSDFTRSDISVASLAQLCGISEAYLRRIFLSKYGVSPKEYIINMRISYAKQLLSLEEFPISTIALMCGYSEPTHFSREFTRRVGVSPSDFKLERQENE
jgi:AraC-like DNA-binding protein